MTALLLGAVAKLWPYIIGAIGLGFAALKLRQSGANAEKAKQDKGRLESIQAKKEKDDEIDALAPADLDARFQRWMQDDKR
jgi:hypothetical protein